MLFHRTAIAKSAFLVIGALLMCDLISASPKQIVSKYISNEVDLALARDKDPEDGSVKDSSKTSLIGFPVIYRTPETRWAFGAAASIRFSLSPENPWTPDSQVRIGGAITQNKQLLLYMPFQVYTKARHWAITGEFGYYDYSYFFYGIGDVVDPDGELFDIDFPRIRIAALRKVAENIYAGLRYNFERVTISELEAGGQLEEGVNGSSGGVITGIGPIIEYDTRDHVYNTTRGTFVRVRYDIQASGLGSDFVFNRAHLDARHFIPINSGTLGFQMFYEGNTSDVPFSQMSLLGGGRRMRGYYRGYYRDIGAYSIQSELRRQLIGRLGAAAFISVGETFDSNPDLINMRWAGGMGLRFILETKKQINVRADYGLAEAGISGFYFTIGQAF